MFRASVPVLPREIAFFGCLVLGALAMTVPVCGQEARWNELNAEVTRLYQEGKYAEAIQPAQESVRVAEATFGREHPNVAKSLNNLGLLYKKQGRYAVTEPLYERALAIKEKMLRPDDPAVATSLNNLAELYRMEGRYADAEPLHNRALAIREKVLGLDHPDVAESLNNLALLYQAEGRYAEAEPFLKRARAILEKALGPDHPNVAASLNNLAALYKVQGRYADAEPLYQHALSIREKVLGLDHPDVAESLNNLALMYQEQGSFSEAEPLYQRALAIVKKAFGPGHTNVATSLTNLAVLYEEQGRYPDAEPLFQRALAIQEQTLGPNHPNVAASLNNLALLYKEQERYAEAEPLYQRALAIVERALGLDHPNTTATLSSLSTLFYAWAQPAQAAPLYDRAFETLAKQFEYYFTYMSESERLTFLATVQLRFSVYFSFSTTYSQEMPALAGKMYDTVLWQKGFIAQSVAALRAKILASGDADAVKLFDQMVAKRNQYAALVSAGPRNNQEWRKDLDQLQSKANELEEQLVRRSAVFAKSKGVAPPSWRDVQKALGKDEAAVEIIRFDFHDGKKWTGKANYVALVLTSASKDEPVLIDLGDAATLEGTLQAAYYHRIAPPSNAVAPWSTDCSPLASAPSSPARVVPATSADPLEFYNSFWKPLEPALNGASRIYISTDGVLNQVALGLVPRSNGKLLMEGDLDLRLVNRTADLTQPAVAHTEQSAALFVNPDFNLAEASYRKSLASLGAPESGSLVGTIPPLNGGGTTLGGCTQLPQVPELELGVSSQIAPMLRDHGWTAKAYVKEQALVETVEKIQSPRLLHIATHGDFLPDPAAKKATLIQTTDTPLPLTSDPMLRSRLFFAGANQTLAGHPLPADLSTGILTAYQASTLKLQGTELVVLSACETGRGDVLDGEGVFGLRRAFQEAGAESVLMTLWEVPANETQELLSNFYHHWVADGMDKHRALVAAQQDERKQVQQRYGRDLPYYWGAFILVGR